MASSRPTPLQTLVAQDCNRMAARPVRSLRSLVLTLAHREKQDRLLIRYTLEAPRLATVRLTPSCGSADPTAKNRTKIRHSPTLRHRRSPQPASTVCRPHQRFRARPQPRERFPFRKRSHDSLGSALGRAGQTAPAFAQRRCTQTDGHRGNHRAIAKPQHLGVWFD